MQIVFIICLLLMSFLPVSSQNITKNKATTENKTFQKDVLGRVNFLGILDEYDRNISLGAEYQFAPKWSAGMDAGYIFQSDYISQNTRTRGMLLRPFIRYYFKEKRAGFLEANFHYKTVAYKVKDWIERDIINGVAAYEELSSFDFNKNVFGMNLMIGDRFRLSKKNNIIQFEPYAGLGARLKRQEAENGFFIPDRNMFTPAYDAKFSYLAILMGTRLTIKL